MTEQQVLQKALAIAQANGFDHLGWRLITGSEPSGLQYTEDDWEQLMNDNQYYTLIFDHEFAEKLWGTEYPEKTPVFMTISQKMPYYYTHLMNMVVADGPLKYLGDNLPND